MLSSREVNQTYFLRGEELWPTKRLVRIQRVRVHRNRMANTAAHRAKAQARQSKSIATAGIPTVREISSLECAGLDGTLDAKSGALTPIVTRDPKRHRAALCRR